mmetsp:Transcript_36861/g.37313  ORF Transcript_36861/g.37313 Transcript_36861/m.37313 type:complete len:217 (+) Transcript_36861:525-1175(+)
MYTRSSSSSLSGFKNKNTSLSNNNSINGMFVTNNNTNTTKQKQKNYDVVDDAVIGVVESNTTTADVVITVAGILSSVPLPISKFLSTSEKNGVNINNNNNTTTVTDNKNKRNGDSGVATDTDTTSNTTTNPSTTFPTRVQVGTVQFLPEVASRVDHYLARQVREIFQRGKQIVQQSCHSVKQHRDYRSHERGLFQQRQECYTSTKQLLNSTIAKNE